MLFPILILAALLGVMNIISVIQSEQRERKRVKQKWEEFNGTRNNRSEDILDD